MSNIPRLEMPKVPPEHSSGRRLRLRARCAVGPRNTTVAVGAEFVYLPCPTHSRALRASKERNGRDSAATAKKITGVLFLVQSWPA